MAGNVTHLDLLTLARSLQAVALRGDRDAVHTELCSMRNALVRHLRDEQTPAASLSPAARAAMQRGQQRLLRDLDAILAHPDESGANCRCVSEVSHLTKALARQASLENALSNSRQAP